MYTFSIDDANGNEVEDTACGGFYGWDYEKNGLLALARENIDSHIEKKQEEHEAKLKIQIKNHVPLEKRVGAMV